MLRHYKAPDTGNASPHFSRRAMMQGLAAIAIAAPVYAEAEDTSDDLAWLIDSYRETVAERDAIDARQERILTDPDCPPYPSVRICEVMTQHHDYMSCHEYNLRSIADIVYTFKDVKDAERLNDAANVAAGDASTFEEWWRRVSVDRVRLIELFDERESRRNSWLEAMNYPALDRRYEELIKNECEIAKAIAEWPCRSLREISLKIDYAVNDLDVRDGLAAVTILESMKTALKPI